jgi:hypothetical protein
MNQNVISLRPEFPILAFHPLADVLPLMEGSEYEDLVASIRMNGQRDPIVVFEGMILDGRNRYRACRDAYRETGKPPIVKTLEEVAGEGADPRQYVADKNLLRRHLTISQRAIYMAQLATWESGFPKSRTSSSSIENPTENDGGCKQPPSLTNAEAGAMANVSESSIKDAKTVLRQGTNEEKLAVIQGKLAVRTAADQIRARRQPQAPLVPPNPDSPSDSAASASPPVQGAVGARMTVPPGKTASRWCLEGMAFEKTGKSTEEAAKTIGMPILTYRQVRDIVLLAKHVELTSTDHQQASEALKRLDETRLLARSYEMVRPIAERFWGPRGQRHGGENRRLEDFEDSIATIVSVLMKARDLSLPYLTEERSAEIAKKLKDGRSSLMDLIRNVEEAVK